MNTTKLPSIVLAVLGILLWLVGMLQLDYGKPGYAKLLFETLFLSGAILFAAAGITWAISNAGQNSKKD